VNEPDNAAAQEYGAMFIPTNALIDGEGKILGIDLHGDDLTQALEGLLEKNPSKLEKHGQKNK